MDYKNFIKYGISILLLIGLYSFNVSKTNTISFSDNPSILSGNNRLVLPDTVTQVESTIAVHPQNPLIIAGSAVTDIYPGGYTTGAYISTNGGSSWYGTNAIKDSTNAIIVTIGNPKIIIDKNGTFILSYIAPSPITGFYPFKIGVSYSSNNGLYWSRTVYVPGVDTADKSICATDLNKASPNYGRSYVVYSEKRGVYFSYSNNGGKDWSSAVRISPTNVNYSRTGAFIAVGPSGQLYVTWPYLAEITKYIGFAKSTDGGLTWASNDKAIPSNPMKDDFRLYLNQCRLNGNPTLAVDNCGGVRNGWIYVVSSEKKVTGQPALDSGDIILNVSTDQGATWPKKYRVNQDKPGARTNYQFFPAAAVDDKGGFDVVYCDARNTISKDSFEVFISRSTNGGISFSDIRVSDHKFKLKQFVSSKILFGISGYIGTGIGLAASGSNLYPFWFDNSTNDEYQSWFSKVDYFYTVGLNDFSISCNGKNVLMNWIESSDNNNYGFNIERKLKGTEFWKNIGYAESIKTGSKYKFFSFTDMNLSDGNYNYRLMKTDDRGNMKYIGINSEVHIGIPMDFKLYQNFPNPFNPSTKINFAIPEDIFVSLKVYNLSGKEVAALVNENRTAGYHSVSFNASALSSGVYYYRLEANGNSKVMKMALIK